MKLWLNSFLLGISGLIAILGSRSVQKEANYPGESVLILAWGIYGLTLAFAIGSNNIDDEQLRSDILVGSVLSCYLLSTLLNLWILFCIGGSDISKRYFWFAIFLNLIGIAEISYYFNDGKTFINL